MLFRSLTQMPVGFEAAIIELIGELTLFQQQLWHLSACSLHGQIEAF